MQTVSPPADYPFGVKWSKIDVGDSNANLHFCISMPS